MSPGIGALTVIAFLGAIQALVIGIALLTLPGARTRLLGALLAIMGAAMTVIAASHTNWGASLWWLYLVEAGLTIVVAPLFYLWVTMVMAGETTRAAGRGPSPARPSPGRCT